MKLAGSTAAPTLGARAQTSPAGIAERYRADLTAVGARSVEAMRTAQVHVGWSIEYDALGARAAFESALDGVGLLHTGAPGIRLDITNPLTLIGRLPGVQSVTVQGGQARVVVDSQARIDHLDPLVRDELVAPSEWGVSPAWNGLRVVFATA